jgi:hypothetical protein
MIGKIGGGGGFGGLLGYVLDKEKQPRILSENMASDTPRDLAREFRRISNGNPRISKPVKHISVSFAPEDGMVEDWLKEAIALRLLDGLGYKETPYLVVAHDRDDPGHDTIHDHDHIHIITSAVDYDGKRVDPSWEAYRMQSILREAEIDFGLRQVASSWEVKRERASGMNLDSDLAQLVRDSFAERPNLKTWLDRLSQSDIDVRFNISKNDHVMGITYLRDGDTLTVVRLKITGFNYLLELILARSSLAMLEFFSTYWDSPKLCYLAIFSLFYQSGSSEFLPLL